jgi:hypothetical protein
MILHEESLHSLRVDFSALPHLEITRLNSVLRSPSVDRIFYTLANIVQLSGAEVHDEDRPLIDWARVANEVTFLQDAIISLQSHLLNTRIRRKADVTKLHLRSGIASVRLLIEDHVAHWEITTIFRLRADAAGLFKDLEHASNRIRELTRPDMTLQTMTALRGEFDDWINKLQNTTLPPGTLEDLARSWLERGRPLADDLDRLIKDKEQQYIVE